MRILHLADIHIMGLSRHKEYETVFREFFEKAKNLNSDIIFIGGDIWHTKCQNITPESIEFMTWMFTEMAKIAPTHIILGNHDGNLTNENRQDTISPIINAINNPNLFLYKKSGVYPIVVKQEKVNLCVYSCFDKRSWTKVKPVENELNIAAFHGSISESKTDLNYTMHEAEEELSFFNGYDFAFLGDIHKQQYLSLREDVNGDDKPWIAYPGSTIQQNYGEDETKGFLCWDIRSKDDWDVEFVELENKQPFITTPWMGTVADTVNFMEAQRGTFLPGSRVRITSTQTISAFETRELQTELKNLRGASDLAFKNDSESRIETIQTDSVNVHKTSLRNDIQAVQKLYNEFLEANKDQHPLDLEQIREGEHVIKDYLNKLNLVEIETPRDIVWSLKSMEFDNLFRYGEKNAIDFTKLNGIVGIFGNNRIGKSAIVGSMMFGLYNSSDRGPLKTAHIINYKKKQAKIKIKINISGKDYIIEREAVRTETPKKKANKGDEFDKATTSVDFSLVKEDGTLCSLNSITRDDTDKEIRRLLGKSEDFLLTAFSNQNGINRFIEEGATERKAILNRFLDLDLFEKLNLYAKDDVKIINIKAAAFDIVSFDKKIKETKDFAQKCIEKVQLSQIQEQNQLAKVEELKEWLIRNEHSKIIFDLSEQSIHAMGVKILTKDIASIEQQKSLSEENILKISNELQTIEKFLTTIDILELKLKQEEIISLNKEITNITIAYSKEDSLLKNQERSVKKLETVPCGDSFPECRFIKDSHEDKKLIDLQRVKVEQLTNLLKDLSFRFQIFQEAKIADLIVEYEKLSNKKNLLTVQLEQEKIKIENFNLNLVSSTESLAKAQKELQKYNIWNKTPEQIEFEEKEKLKESLISILTKIKAENTDLLMQIHVQENMIKKLEQDKEEAKKLSRQLKIFESVFAAFHKNGIPAKILKKQLPAINQELDKLLNNVVDFKISLETDVNTNAMDVFIEDLTSRRVIELASGMEKMIASLALRVALNNLSSLPKPDFLILDECFTALDSNHLSKITQFLQSLKPYFRMILVISHIQEIKECAEILIDIENRDLESWIQYPLYKK